MRSLATPRALLSRQRAVVHIATICAFSIARLSVSRASDAATIRVPADVPTIQQAIVAAADGDTVLVAPGTYYEQINFIGKAITVTSEAGAEATTIDGQGGGAVVTFRSREGRASVLSGFTITGGGNLYLGAITIGGSSPTILDNIITGNSGCSGVGIQSGSSAPRIEHNKIVRNTTNACTGGRGIGISIIGTAADAAAEIIGNEISDNTSIGSTFGGGVSLNAAGSVILRDNVIRHNVTVGPSGCGWGGGVISANFTAATLVNNLITGNTACFGGGVLWDGNNGTNIWVNNTIAGNDAMYHPGVAIGGYAWNRLYNNIITSATGPALFCETNPSTLPVLTANDVFSADGTSYAGNCVDGTGSQGNISAEPAFVDPAHDDYRLQMTSPAIDAGAMDAPALPSADLGGAARIVDGNGDGVAAVDMGAFEYHNHAPVVSAGGDLTIELAGECVAAVTLNALASDPDGDALTLTWSGPGGSTSGASASFALPAGSYSITLTANDGNGGFAKDTVSVRVVDTTPPVIAAATATPSVVLSTNHTMVPVTINMTAFDGCGAAVSCRIVAVTSNEPVNGVGDGDTGPDWEVTGDLSVNLRAERSGTGTGRVYSILVACTDESGNESTSTVRVMVPHTSD